jgi:hypothetical protein
VGKQVHPWLKDIAAATRTERVRNDQFRTFFLIGQSSLLKLRPFSLSRRFFSLEVEGLELSNQFYRWIKKLICSPETIQLALSQSAWNLFIENINQNAPSGTFHPYGHIMLYAFELPRDWAKKSSHTSLLSRIG